MSIQKKNNTCWLLLRANINGFGPDNNWFVTIDAGADDMAEVVNVNGCCDVETIVAGVDTEVVGLIINIDWEMVFLFSLQIMLLLFLVIPQPSVIIAFEFINSFNDAWVNTKIPVPVSLFKLLLLILLVVLIIPPFVKISLKVVEVVVNADDDELL